MKLADHQATPRGRLFLYGGITLGLLFAIGFITHGFGLLRGRDAANGGPPLFSHQGDRLVVPEGSPLRDHLVVAPAGGGSMADRLLLPAVVESDPSRTAAVLSPLSGRVVELKVALGERVHQGQILALIDSPDLEQAYADYDKAQSAATLTRKTRERQEGQLSLGTAATRDVDQAKSDEAQAAAELIRAEGRLRTLGVGGERRPKLLSVSAPVAGSVTTLNVARGNMLNDTTQPLMTVADLSTVWVSALVPEKDVASVSKDQQAEVAVDAYPARQFKGHVLFVSDVLEADSRRNKVRIAFDNADFALKPNMFASVTLLGGQHPQVTVPTSALLMNNDRITVFVATAPWTFERRTVHARMEEGSVVALDSGVALGESVLVKGAILLND